MARRASEAAGAKRRVIGVSRFSNEDVRRRLENWGVETIRCDLLDESAVEALPGAPNVVYMTGFKFGASGAAGMTWAVNCYVPALTARRFAGSRIVAFSTGNVYRMMPADSSGSVESDPPQPVGEYAMSTLGRERMLEYFSVKDRTPMALLRLNYATELRYGVLVDIAEKVRDGRPVDLSMSRVNVIWLGDANAMALAALAHAESPANVINLAGEEILSVRDIAEKLGRLMGKTVQFSGQESPTALLNNGQRGRQLLGQPRVNVDLMLRWTADWVARGGESLGKPTHFEVRDGQF
jgi:nucleoside-diphosphate-sugar epimerase